MLVEALEVFGVTDLSELDQWYDVNVVQYAEQMLSSEKTLRDRITEVERERIRRQQNLQSFIQQFAIAGTKLKVFFFFFFPALSFFSFRLLTFRQGDSRRDGRGSESDATSSRAVLRG